MFTEYIILNILCKLIHQLMLSVVEKRVDSLFICQVLSFSRFLVPGWRLGWIVINDRHDTFTEVRNSQTFLIEGCHLYETDLNNTVV